MEQVNSYRKVDWKRGLLDRLSALSRNTAFSTAFVDDDCPVGIHLAVFVEPYLSLLLQGKKTIESRFSVNKHAPFKQVQRGDVLILKRTAGPICGMCRIADAWFYKINSENWTEIERYSTALCMDDSAFWDQKKAASFATLMQIEDVCLLEEFEIGKDDPRSWVVVKPTPNRQQGTLPWSP